MTRPASRIPHASHFPEKRIIPLDLTSQSRKLIPIGLRISAGEFRAGNWAFPEQSVNYLLLSVGHGRFFGIVLLISATGALFFSRSALSQSQAPSSQGKDEPASANVLGEAQPSARLTDTLEISPNPLGESIAETNGPSSKDPRSYGLWVLVPAIVAILMTIFTRQVIPALFIGVVAGACMMVPCLSFDAPYFGVNPLIAAARLTVEKYAVGAIHEFPDTSFNHIRILVFTLVIAFMVGVIGRNGGTAGMVSIVSGKTASRRRGALTAWLAGLVVFFDDYANCMIIGPTMRSVFDRLRLSRAKLAYIIDSTAAPVASIALVGTWVGAEVGYIQTGLEDVCKLGAPEFMLNADGSIMTGMQAFLNSLPYRFYPILTLLMVFLIALLGRDFGPMRRAESRALSRSDTDPEPRATPAPTTLCPSVNPPAASMEGAWWLGFFPVAVLVIATLATLAATGVSASGGWSALPPGRWWERLGELVGKADSYLSIMYGAVLSALTAVLLTIPSRACSTRDAIEAGLESMSRAFPAIVILVLAWALSSVQQDLMLGQVLTHRLQAIEFPARWLPFSIFVSSALISFATGTSWGTMGILCPITATLAAKLAAPLEPHVAVTVLYAAIGAVLSGSVFGDHCSPISDTTVLSSIGADCKHEEHVWTQLPYSLVAAIFAMGIGDLLTSVYDWHWYYGLLFAACGLTLFLFLIARKARPSLELSSESTSA